MMSVSRRQFLKTSAAGALVAGSLRVRPMGAQPATSTPESPVATVRYLGQQFRNNPLGVTGADGATSTVLPNGEFLWVFGDTVEGPFETIRGLDLTPFNSNTAAIVPRQDVSSGIKRFHFLAAP